MGGVVIGFSGPSETNTKADAGVVQKAPSVRIAEEFGRIGKFHTTSSDCYEFSEAEVGIKTSLRTHSGNWKKLGMIFGGRPGICSLIKELIEENADYGVRWRSDERPPSQIQRMKIPIHHSGDKEGEPFMFLRIEHYDPAPHDEDEQGWIVILLD